MAVIHRMLCTHCTFGSSELESNTVENAEKVLGYSVRRSSFPEPDRGPLRSAFRSVERLLSYDLPRDTPPARKESLAADATPSRFVFMPNLGGWQAAAFVSYRSRDTHGRVGSYFADVIAARLERDNKPWCPLELLKLWPSSHASALGNNWWCDSEESLACRDKDGRWKPADAETLAELRGSAAPFVDDRLLHQFLTLSPGEPADDPGMIVPPRWWAMQAAHRRHLFAGLLNALIQSRKSGGRESVIVAVEPSVAAVLFYGVFRLLPARLREGIGFSTYEAAPERPLTQLVATTFMDGTSSSAELPPQLAAHGFACNTFRDEVRFGKSQPIPAYGFVHHAIELASSAGWERLDGFLYAIDTLPRPDFRNLDELARIDGFVTRYVTGSDKLQSLGTEPPASPGSDGEKFRRIRFRDLVGAVAPCKAGEWPCDMLYTAIRWLGDDFIEAWNAGGPLADTLRSRLPVDNAGLQQVFDTLQPDKSIPIDCVRDAVLQVASASNPPSLPPAFLKFIADPRWNSRRRDVTPDVSTLTQAVIEGLAERNLQHLIEIGDSEHTDAILDAIVALENAQPGRWRELNLPLVSIIKRRLEEARDDLEDQASFFVRHKSLASILDQDRIDSERISRELGHFFGLILQFEQRMSMPLLPGQHLSANGRSRVKALTSWLDLAPPADSPKNRKRLNDWKTVHTSIESLKEPATRAGRKCPISLSEAAEAYDRLTRDNQGPGSDATQRMRHFLKRSLDGLKVEESARQTITRWVVAALPDDPDRFDLPGLDGSKRTANQRRNFGTSRGPAWLFGVGTTLGVIAMGTAVVTFWPRPTPTQPETAGRGITSPAPPDSPAAPAKPSPESSGPDGTAVLPHSMPPDALPAENSTPLTAESLNFNAELKDGAIEATWNRTIAPGTKLTLAVMAPSDSSNGYETTVKDVATGQERIRFPNKNVFGDYKTRLTAETPTGATVRSDEITLAITKPSPPVIKDAKITVDTSGGPRLCITLKELPAPKHGARSGVVTVGAPPLEAPLSDHMEFHLPADKLSPADFLPGTPPLKLHFDTDVGSSDSCEIPIEVPDGILKQEINARLARKQIHGVTHICALEDTFQPGKQTPLLTLPWWMVGTKLGNFGLELLPSGKHATSPGTEDFETIVLRPTLGNPTQWECKSGEVSLGFFEVIKQDPWKPELVFKAADSTAQDSTKAYAQLRTFKLCFLDYDRPICTAQLINPRTVGPLVLQFPGSDDSTALPSMFKKPGFPIEWVGVSAFLTGGAASEGPRRGLKFRLDKPDLNTSFVAKVVASCEENEVAAQVNFIRDYSDRRQTRFQVNGWKWVKLQSGKAQQVLQTDDNSDVPAKANEKVSPKLLSAVGKRKKDLDDLLSEIATRTPNPTADDPDLQDAEILARLKSDLQKLRSDRRKNNDDLFLPCWDLYDALVNNGIEIADWQMAWEVQPTTTTGATNIPAEIPGGFVVVGVVGTKDGQPPVIFAPEKDNR